jgi:hypothetical protein
MHYSGKTKRFASGSTGLGEFGRVPIDGPLAPGCLNKGKIGL